MNTLTKNIDYFKQIVNNHTTQEIIDLWYNKFGEIITKNQIRSVKYRNKLYSNIKTTFSKERQPKDRPTKPMFAEKEHLIKNEKGKWVYKGRYIYELQNGKIPQNKTIMFLDGNRKNCKMSNIKIVTKRERIIIARNQLYFKNAELTKTGLLIAKLKLKTKEVA